METPADADETAAAAASALISPAAAFVCTSSCPVFFCGFQEQLGTVASRFCHSFKSPYLQGFVSVFLPKQCESNALWTTGVHPSIHPYFSVTAHCALWVTGELEPISAVSGRKINSDWIRFLLEVAKIDEQSWEVSDQAASPLRPPHSHASVQSAVRRRR